MRHDFMRKPIWNGILISMLIFMASFAGGTARAMEWSKYTDLRNGTIVYTGTGPVVFDDAQRLAAIIPPPASPWNSASVPRPGADLGSLERYASSRKRLRIELNSPGGNLVGGIRLGAFIRDSGFDTAVIAGAECHSACTIAFLGGVSRSVVGKFGVHAMAFNQQAVAVKGGLDDKDVYDVQALSSMLILYTRDMLGSAELADASLRIGSRQTALVGDTELRDWNVITIASRPTQAFAGSALSTVDCGSNTMVQKIVCGSLTFARADIRITKALKTLRPRVDTTEIDAQQSLWRAYSATCEERSRVVLPHSLGQATSVSEIPVEECLTEAYKLRVRELEALVEYHSVGASATAARGWHRKAN
jgi:uncharacterized protein YecT (DUF1311 family)